MYQLPKLAKVPGLVHGFSTREEGNQGFGFGPKGMVIQNRGRFLKLVHSSFPIGGGVAMVPFQLGYEETIVVVGPAQAGLGMMASGAGPKCEALITGEDKVSPFCRTSDFCLEGGFYLFAAMADCFPIILYAPVERELALVHASRVSTERKIALKTVGHLKRHSGVDPKTIVAGIGPGVRTYECERDTFGPADDPEWRPFIREIDRGKILIDLAGFNAYLLEEDAGVPREQIEISPCDTFTDERFYSHRARRKGRHACAVGMAPLE